MRNMGIGSLFWQTELHSVMADGEERPWLLGRVRAGRGHSVIDWERTQSHCSRSRWRSGIDRSYDEKGHGACDRASDNDLAGKSFNIHS